MYKSWKKIESKIVIRYTEQFEKTPLSYWIGWSLVKVLILLYANLLNVGKVS